MEAARAAALCQEVLTLPFYSAGDAASQARQLLNTLGTAVRDGHRYRANTLTSDPTESAAPVALIEVVDTTDLAAANAIDGEVEALQVIWPDSEGRLPWDEGYANGPEAQPYMGIVPDVLDK